MIEAWLSASRDDQVRLAGDRRDHAGVRGEAGLERQDGRRVLERGQLALERLVHRHRPGDRPDRAGPDAEVADGRQRRLAQPRMVGQPEVVVRRQADEPLAVDRDDRALRRGHDPQRPIQVALAEGRRPRRRGSRGVGAAGAPGLRGPGHVVQSMMTLPESPARAAANAASCSRNPKRWVIAGRDVQPGLEHDRHLVPGLVHLPAVDAAERQHLEHDGVDVQRDLLGRDAQDGDRRRRGPSPRSRPAAPPGCRTSPARRRSPRPCPSSAKRPRASRSRGSTTTDAPIRVASSRRKALGSLTRRRGGRRRGGRPPWPSARSGRRR